MTLLEDLLDVRAVDARDARRRKLLNVSLLILMVLALLAYGVASIVYWAGEHKLVMNTVAVLSHGLAVICLTAFVINRYGPGWLASTVLVLGMVLLVTFADEPQEVVAGRSTLMFLVPIVMASFIFAPWVSLAIAGVSSMALGVVAWSLWRFPNPWTLAAFFAIGLVAWIVALYIQKAFPPKA